MNEVFGIKVNSLEGSPFENRPTGRPVLCNLAI